MTRSLVLYAAMRCEADALSRGLARVPRPDQGAAVTAVSPVVVRSGVGPAAARRSAALALPRSVFGLAVVGVGGALRADLATGDVVVADEVRTADRRVVLACPAPQRIAELLRSRGLTVHVGPVVSVRHPVGRPGRRRLARTGALAVDTESAWLLSRAPAPAGELAWTRDLVACVRVIADTAPSPLLCPGTVRRIGQALRVLPAVAGALAEWAAQVPCVPQAADGDGGRATGGMSQPWDVDGRGVRR